MSSKKRILIWIIPIVSILFVLLFGLFTRLMVGEDDSQQWDYGIEDHVPGASPHSSGKDSR